MNENVPHVGAAFAWAGWYFLRSRHYDPAIGRFVQEDKIGRAGGSNWYSYVAGSPTEARDPSGMVMDYYLIGEMTARIELPNCWNPFSCDPDGFSGRDPAGTWGGFNILTNDERDILYAEYQQNFNTQESKGKFDAGCPKFSCGTFTRALDSDEFSIVYSGILILESRLSTEGQYAATWAITYLRSGLFAVNPLKARANQIFVSDTRNRIVWVNPSIDAAWFPGMGSNVERAYRLAHEAGHFYYNHLREDTTVQCNADRFADRATGYEFGFYCVK